ncbi:hypothetical protein GOP47_0026650 [Adiantum capillus-veneris]|nr:hypothetical protein GOP47_0026650 [Adiantum capillus-veneris]
MAGPMGAGTGMTPGKRGRALVTASGAPAPPNNTAVTAAAVPPPDGSASVGTPQSSSVLTMLGPTLQVHNSFADQNNKRIVMALQSGLKSELTWALNTLTLLSFKEKDDPRKDAMPLAKIPGILDSLLTMVDDWRNISNPRESRKLFKPRLFGSSCVSSGFGSEYETVSPHDPLVRLRSIQEGLSLEDGTGDKEGSRKGFEYWLDEEGLFNLDEEGRAERQLSAVAASNVIRNFSFMPENDVLMARNSHCLETLIRCMEDHHTEDEELVTNAIETIVNLAPYLNLRSLSEQLTEPHSRTMEKRAIEAILRMLESPVKAWHCSAAELLGRLVVNPDNEPSLLPYIHQIYKRLVDLLSLPGADAQAAAVAALYNFAEVNMDCRLRLASERWAIGRLVKIIQAPHPLSEVCRKAALTLESLASEPQNKSLLLAYEHTFAELAFSDAKLSDTFARILWELSSRSSSKVAAARGVWGS